MKVRYNSINGRLSVELEGDSQKEIFGELAAFQEVFEHARCGKCNQPNVKFVVRNVDDNDFYEMHCLDCRARLSFGQHKKGGSLFPSKKDKEGKWLPNNGWTVYTPENKKD